MYISGMVLIGALKLVGSVERRKRMFNNKLASWMFNMLYWLDLQMIKRNKWKNRLKMAYINSGMSKKFKKGSFKKTWRYIKKEGLIREGRKSNIRQKIRRK